MMGNNPVLVGHSRVVINYPFPVQLGGYRAERFATKTEETFYIQCLSFKNKEKFVHMISLDVVGVDNLLMGRIKDSLPDNHNVFICATHTHSGPAGLLNTADGPLKGTADIFGTENIELIDYLKAKCLLAIEDASQDYELCNIAQDSIKVSGVTTNRNNSELKGNPMLSAYCIETQSKKKILLYNYACHPTVLGPDNEILSGDLIHFVNQRLECHYDLVFFMNANSGDISTRYTKNEGSFDEIGRLGNMLLTQMKQLRFISFKRLRDLEYTEFEISLQMKNKEIHNALFSLLKLNNSVILGIPGEITSELTIGLLKSFPHLIISSCTNGYFLYMAEGKSYELGWYESEISPFIKGEGENTIEFIRTLLNTKSLSTY